MSVEIVCCAGQHLEGIMEIENRVFVPPWSEASIRAEMSGPDSLFLAAVEDGSVVGFCILHQTLDEGEIYQIAVAAHCRRRGIADRLMEKAAMLASANGVRSIFLEVRAGNLPAAALYHKHGFERIGCRKNYYDAPKEDAILMRLEIDEMERQA